jgi:Flp pilus assembly protein TadG
LKHKPHFRNTPQRTLATLRADRRSGAELIEFTLALLPLFAMVFVLLDFAWIVFVQATVVRAVRVAVRTGITLTASQMGTGACLTDTVKGIVQQNGLGFLQGTAGLAYIKVNYYLPPPPGTTTAATNVSTLSSGNAPGNIMQVSVNNYSVSAFLPRIFSWKQAPDSSAFVFTSSSADLIEPSSSPPCIGTAP